MTKQKSAKGEGVRHLSEKEVSAALDAPKPTEYQPTANEVAGAEAYRARRAQRPAFPSLDVNVSQGAAAVKSDHPDQLLAASLQVAALGLSDVREFNSLLKDVIEYSQRSDGSGVDAVATNEALALVVGIGPTNTVEAMLAVQMAAVHDAAMVSARQLNGAKTLEQRGVHTKALNNLTRTFATQAEALKKLRGTGEQKVTVEHKHYHLAPGALAPGSQAVLGDVTQGGGASQQSEAEPHVRSIPERHAMHGDIEANGAAMPWPGGHGLEGLPVPRRAGRTEGGTDA